MRTRKVGIVAVLSLVLSSLIAVISPTAAHASLTGITWGTFYTCGSSNSSCVAERYTFCDGYKPDFSSTWWELDEVYSDRWICRYKAPWPGGSWVEDTEIWVEYNNGTDEFERYEDSSCNKPSWNWQYNHYYYYGDQVYHNGTTWRMKYTGGHSYWNEPGHPSWDYVWQNIGCL